MNDLQIKKLFLERSELAIAALSEKYGRYLSAIARNILRNASDAEECVNDAYLKTWNSIPPADPENLKAFTGKITRNRALDMYESAQAQKRGGGETAAVLDELAEMIGAEDNLSAGMELKELTDVINGFLAGLDADKRKMFLRRYWYMDSISDVAAFTGKSESNVKTTLFRLRSQLKDVLIKEGINI